MAETTRSIRIGERELAVLQKDNLRWKAYGCKHTPDVFAVDFVINLQPILEANRLRLIPDLSPSELGRATEYFYSKDYAWKANVIGAIRRIHEENEWNDFLKLDIIEDAPLSASSSQDITSRNANSSSWGHEFRGINHLLLWDHLRYYYKKSDNLQLYAHMCSIVQSSGMGKSRTVDELGKQHFLIPLNLNEFDSGYPQRDEAVVKFLTAKLPSADHARGRCCMFLKGLFEHTAAVLKSTMLNDGIKDKAGLITWFYSKMSKDEEFRKDFYHRVLQIVPEKPVRVSKMVMESSRTQDCKSKEPGKSEKLHGLVQVDGLLIAAANLIEVLRNSSHTWEEGIQVIISFDEAHVLCKDVTYDPTAREPPWSMFITLRDALRSLHSFPIWSLFLSTTGKLLQLNPHHAIDPLLRLRKELFKTASAFTDLTYDLFAPSLVFVRSDGSLRFDILSNTVEPPMKKRRSVKSSQHETLTLERVTRTDFIVKFGRPLFSLRYEHGNKEVRSQIIRFAATKLICNEPSSNEKMGSYWLKDDPNAIIACLSQRLFLEFNTSSYNAAEETQIAAHMRLCLKVESDNQFVSSWTPSEPLLAEAAATLMSTKDFRPADSLKKILTGYSIDIGERGELVAALAIMVARDRAVRKRLKVINFEEVLSGYLYEGEDKIEPFFRAVTVLELLEQVFAYKKVLTKKEMKRISKDFEGAYVYFNHFIKPLDQSTCTLKALLIGMVRGAAFRCATNMPGIDALHGILFKSPDGIMLRLDRTSTWVNQIKNDASITTSHWQELLKRMEPFLIDLFKDVDNPLPVIRTVYVLPAKKEELLYSRSIVDLGEGKSVVCHDFWCGGMGSFFLPNNEDEAEDSKSWQALLNTTLKFNQIFSEKSKALRPAADNRKRLTALASSAPEFCPWVRDTD